MYTQRHKEEPSIPQNYSGNAFRYPPIEELISATEKLDGEKNRAPSLPLLEKEETVLNEHEPFSRKIAREEKRSTFGHRDAWGSEELLLLGLCLLLGGDGHAFLKRGDGWNEVLPYLVFLLFFG